MVSAMPNGFSTSEIAAIIDVHPKKVPQAIGPALDKVRRLWRVDPTRTLALLLADFDRLAPMSDSEIAIRELMLKGHFPK